MISPAVVTATNGGANKYDLEVADLQEDIQITEDSIKGKLNLIKKYPGFGDLEASNPGHYLALDIEVPDGATVTTKIEGGTNPDYTDVTEDEFCVYRISSNTQKIKIKTRKDEQEVEKTYDLTGLTLLETPVGKEAFDNSKTDYGGFGKTTDFYDDLTVTWNGTNATVQGTLKWAAASQKRSKPGNYYPFALVGDYYENKEITVNNGGNVQTTQDTDWVCSISEKTKTEGLTVKCGDTLIANFDFSRVILTPNGDD